MVAQGQSPVEGKAEFTKHMIRMHHAGHVSTKPEANEIILINSHDGASSNQMLAGVFRFVCCNRLVVGNVSNDIRIPHRKGKGGNIQGEVIEGAFCVLDDFEAVDASTEGMKALTLQPEKEHAFATAALALRYGERSEGQAPAPITAEQLMEARRPEDLGHRLWISMNRLHENMMRGGQPGRSVHGRRIQSRAIGSIDRSVSLNRALWVLAEEMRRLKH